MKHHIGDEPAVVENGPKVVDNGLMEVENES